MPTLSAAVEAEAITCPRCDRAYAVRASREGVFERVVSLAYYYPFRCQLCRHRFRALNWGVRYERTERREFERLPTRMPVTMIWGDQEGAGLVSELSISGATLQTDHELPSDRPVQLRFRSSGTEVEVTVDMSMVRSRRGDEVGVEFTGLSSEQEARLTLLVRDLLERMKRP